MSTIDLVVTDLDGTLWDAGERIHSRTLQALHELEARGVPLLVATGRRPRSAAGVLAREGLTPPAVLLDGAIGYDLSNRERFHQAPFDRDAAAVVLHAFESCGVSPCLYVDRRDADVVVGERPGTRPEHLAAVGEWLARGDLAAVVATEDVLAIGVVGCQAEALQPVVARLEGVADAAVVRDLYFGGTTLIARPRGISKWQGVEAWCERAGLDAGNVLALGDAENDLELLTAARISCVVSDGCDAALALADHVIEPAAAGGWSAVLDLV